MVQNCLKTMTLLLSPRHGAAQPSTPSEAPTNPDGPPSDKEPLPLGPKSLRALVSLLRSAALDYDHHQV